VTRLTDIVLPSPVTPPWLHGSLLFVFSLHFLFVALTLGTGLLATFYYVAGHFGPNPALRGWDKDFLDELFAHKSLAIVLGVGPILLMQVGHSVPFLTGVNVMAPLWMTLVVALLVTLGLYEWQHRRARDSRWRFFFVSAGALLFLLYVPATFVSVLSSAERPRSWLAMIKAGGKLPFDVAVHALLRFLHVLGASVVVTAALHYLLQPKDAELKRRHLLGWISGGLAFQFVVGVGLFGSVRPYPNAIATATTLVGVAASALLGLVTLQRRNDRWPRPMTIAILLPFILVPMFLTRQVLQDRILYPFDKAIRENAVQHAARLEPFRGPALAAFRASLATPYDNGLALYSRSCAFCHGAVGNGRGEAASRLEIPPEDLTRIRMDDRKLTEVLLKGIDGSAMPRFDFYLESELASLRTFLRDKVGLRQGAEPVARTLSEADRKQAQDVFDSTCVVCHGKDGRGSDIGRPMRPSPPDFTAISFAPSRAFQIVTEGYPGTLMRSYADLSEGVRWALVEHVQRFYRGGMGELEPGDGGVALDGAVDLGGER
jgi:mono/diheme cytochrome c family protein